MVRLRCARTATTDIIRMRARLTGTTALIGSLVESLSGQVRGSAAGSDADLIVALEAVALIADSAGVDSRDAVSRDVDRLAEDSGAERHAVVAFTVAEVRTVAVVRTVVAVRTAEAATADTGKIQQ